MKKTISQSSWATIKQMLSRIHPNICKSAPNISKFATESGIRSQIDALNPSTDTAEVFVFTTAEHIVDEHLQLDLDIKPVVVELVDTEDN